MMGVSIAAAIVLSLFHPHADFSCRPGDAGKMLAQQGDTFLFCNADSHLQQGSVRQRLQQTTRMVRDTARLMETMQQGSVWQHVQPVLQGMDDKATEYVLGTSNDRYPMQEAAKTFIKP